MKNVRQRSLYTFSLLLAGFLAATPSIAADVTEITIDHADPECRVRLSENGVLKTPAGVPLAEGPTLSAGKGNKVVITIVHPNPLLFDYSVKKGATTKTSNQTNLEKFVDTGLTPFLKSLGGAKGGKAETEEEKEKKTPSCSTIIPALGDLANLVPTLDARLAERNVIAAKSLTNLADAKQLMSTWKPPDWAKRIADDKKALADVGGRIASGKATAEEVACAGVVALATGEIPNLEQELKDLGQFVLVFEQIDQPISFDLFTVDPTSDQAVDVEFTKTKSFPDGLQTNRCLGKKSFSVSPRSRVNISVAPAVVYSFVHDPSFAAKASSDHFVITKTDDPYKALDLAAMLEIEPNAWDLGPINLGVQLGVSPQTKLGLFLGFSLRANDLFTLGAGIAFQRVDRLQEGLHVGETISSQDLLKTDKAFQTGLYLHLTIGKK
jgi:hypothetical protein